ncbi:PREDICTED: rhomboid-related protein 1 [Nipponia nippon]|uniref:rhomboid-related protein 1 n=1 Tax=Nipponia nippon TaxID=128390 RepID=UPI000511918A|nr:PREDICTED: rhomboid-related protein 1 [Nipponia nippon]
MAAGVPVWGRGGNVAGATAQGGGGDAKVDGTRGAPRQRAPRGAPTGDAPGPALACGCRGQEGGEGRRRLHRVPQDACAVLERRNRYQYAGTPGSWVPLGKAALGPGCAPGWGCLSREDEFPLLRFVKGANPTLSAGCFCGVQGPGHPRQGSSCAPAIAALSVVLVPPRAPRLRERDHVGCPMVLGARWCGVPHGAGCLEGSECPGSPGRPVDALCRAPQLDPENTGFIGVETFASLVHSHELPLDPAKLDMLVALAQGNDEGQVCYQELVDLIIVFLCYGARLNKWVLQTYHPEYMKSPLVYHPGHRARAWRFLTYMFMHVGLEQLGFNALLQLMIGVPLEMVHGILRISFLYLAGVLNWAGMRCPYKLLRMVLALVCMSSEVGRAVWLRFSPPLPASGPQPSFMAHLAGAIVGISMGLTILRSYEESLQDQCGWWVLLLSYGTFLLFAVFWNIFAYDLLGAHIPPPPVLPAPTRPCRHPPAIPKL